MRLFLGNWFVKTVFQGNGLKMQACENTIANHVKRLALV
jgi:hypothetical protein